jgi:nucleoid DNA-binding protein
MTQEDFVKQVASETGITSTKAKQVLEAYLTALSKELSTVGVVWLGNIGILKVKNNKARMGTNPRTGKALAIKASKSLKITTKAAMKRELNA